MIGSSSVALFVATAWAARARVLRQDPPLQPVPLPQLQADQRSQQMEAMAQELEAMQARHQAALTAARTAQEAAVQAEAARHAGRVRVGTG